MKLTETMPDTELVTLTETAKNHSASVARLKDFLKSCPKDNAESATVALGQHEAALAEITALINTLAKPKL